jgi:hypothetical protein
MQAKIASSVYFLRDFWLFKKQMVVMDIAVVDTVSYRRVLCMASFLWRGTQLVPIILRLFHASQTKLILMQVQTVKASDIQLRRDFAITSYLQRWGNNEGGIKRAVFHQFNSLFCVCFRKQQTNQSMLSRSKETYVPISTLGGSWPISLMQYILVEQADQSSNRVNWVRLTCNIFIK